MAQEPLSEAKQEEEGGEAQGVCEGEINFDYDELEGMGNQEEERESPVLRAWVVNKVFVKSKSDETHDFSFAQVRGRGIEALGAVGERA
jgi:hypothetical protein